MTARSPTAGHPFRRPGLPGCAAALAALLLALPARAEGEVEIVAAPEGSPPARAAAPGAQPLETRSVEEAGGRYAVTVRLLLGPEVEAARHDHRPWPGGPAPAAAVTMLGEPVRAAFRRAVLYRFLPATELAEPDLELAIESVKPDLIGKGGLWQARVDVVARLNSGGREVERFDLLGEAPLRIGPDGLRVGFEAACAAAVAEFGRAFDRSPAVGHWLESRGLHQPRGAERPALLGFGDLGVDLPQRSGRRLPQLELQGGAAWRFAFVRGVAAWGRYGLAPPPDRYWPSGAELTLLRLGLEVGGTLRLGEVWELQAGAGLHWVHGEVTLATPAVDIGHGAVGASLIAEARWISPWRFAAARPRLAVAWRRGVAGTLRYQALGSAFGPFSEVVFLVGFEHSPQGERLAPPSPPRDDP